MPVIGLVSGATHPIRGLLFLGRNRSLWKYALIPAVLNLTVIAIASWFLFDRFDELYGFATAFVSVARPELWYRWPDWVLRWLLKWLIGGVLLAASLVVLYVVFLLVAAILSSPFNDVLAERTELLYRRRVVESPFSVRLVVRDGARTVVEELRKAAFFIGVSVLLLPLHLVPGIGSICYAVVSGGFTMFFLTLEFVDFAMARRRLTFAQKRAALLRHKSSVLGFGATMFAAITIPLANLLVLPVGVVAGTLLYLDLEEAADGALPETAAAPGDSG